MENKIRPQSWEENWDQICKKAPSDFKQLAKLEKKLQVYFQTIVKVYFPNGILQSCKTPNELMAHCGMTPWVIPLPKNDRNDWSRLNNPKIRKRPVPLHYHLHNFMMTRVPSDYYRLQRPSLALQGD